MPRATLVLTAALLLAAPPLAPAVDKRPLQVDDLFRFRRVGEPQVSPDGTQVVYVVSTVDLAGNKTTSNLWLAPAHTDAPPRKLTTAPKKDRHPRWAPDGKHVLFESNRSGESQLWVIDVTGGEGRQLTSLSTEASNGTWSPDGKRIAFVSAVYPEFSAKPFAESDALNKKRKEEAEKNPVKAKVFTRLFFRHWDDYVEDKRQHLFVMNNDGSGVRDVTPGDRDAYPTSSTFSVGDDFTFSPDGSHLVFTAVPERDEAWSTNYDLCRVPIGGGKIETLTASNPAADGAPRFSPDGKYLAYRAQKRPGYEGDRWELMVAECDPSGAVRGAPHSVSAEVDAWVSDFVWGGANGEKLAFLVEQNGGSVLYETSARGGKVERLTKEHVGQMGGLSATRDAKTLAYLKATLTTPPEVFVKAGSKPRNVSRNEVNAKLLGELDLPHAESVKVEGAGGTPMQMWVIKPPGFDPSKKWPLVYLVHGGPQGAWEDGWSYRWNPAVWAAQGYVVALPNPRGSTGFGQKYVDEISGDWGGKCFEDLMAGVAYLERQPYVDKDRMAAAGASFGGYMMNWFEGHTTKFKTLITHCGVYNFESMYALTDEIWFDEWEHGGPPWATRDSYEKHSPHRYAKNFQTPMLIVHNDLDFRVPVAEGLQLFTTLQRLGVPSKMINFPDEGHWVLKPANSKFWHEQVFAWLKKYAPPGGR
jgi:dipeptidyl aminopeptidase/acylaminoacyl peptidase